MPHPFPQDERDEPRAPLVAIGLVVLGVLFVPIALYSGGPEGPAKVGDVVFSTDRHRLKLLNPESWALERHQDFCIVEARTQLIVQKTGIPPDGSLIAEVIGNHDDHVPYCLPRVPVILHPHQATLKADVLGAVWQTFARFLSPA